MTPDEFLKREEEVRQAIIAYPQDEMGEAYKRWQIARGEVAITLQSADETIAKAKQEVLRKAHKPCTQPGCSGIMELEGICSGCVEGKKGYKSKWTCEVCLHRELSKEDFWELLQRLNSSSKE
jgi:hypothetical protein